MTMYFLKTYLNPSIQIYNLKSPFAVCRRYLDNQGINPGFFLTTFAKTQGEKNSTNVKSQGLFWAKTQRTGSEIVIVIFETSNICAERAEKMQFLVFFDQISPQKFKQMTKHF